jgi:drug/metabolite transporter (DMT)-like permease
MIISILASLVAGFLNAVSGVFQRKGIGSPEPERLYTKTQITTTSKNKFWQIGALAEGLAAIIELVALYFGSLLLVEPLLMTNLVFLLIIVHFRLKKLVTLHEWIGIGAICIGVSSFLIAANPHGGKGSYGIIWLAPVLTIVPLMFFGAVAARRIHNQKSRGLIGALVGGLSLGLTAALTRLAMLQLHSGIIPTLTHWPLYALIASAIVSLFAVQVGYGSGPLTITQSILEISSPIVSILLGLLLFGDRIDTSGVAISVETFSFLIIIIGVVILSASKRILSLESTVTSTEPTG